MRWYTFFVALSLLTRIPVPDTILAKAYEKNISSSVMFYPVVGGLIGALLCLFSILLPATFPAFLTSSLMLVVWVGITGALHLDGVADSADAYFVSHQSPEKTLDVFRDPHVGAMSVICICLLLILKCALIAALISALNSTLASSNQITSNVSLLSILFFCPIVSRFLAVLYMQYTAYARNDGMAAGLHLREFRFAIGVMGIALCLLGILLFSFVIVFLIILVAAVFLWGWRRLWLNRIGGYTGDCVGALIEFFEVIFLLILAWLLL